MASSFSFSLTPNADYETFRRAGAKAELISARYIYNGESSDLTLEKGDSVVFDDPTGRWSVEDCGLILDYEITVRNPSAMYSEMNRSPSTILGLVPRISSDSSRQKIVFPQFSVTVPMGSTLFRQHVAVEIPAGRIRGSCVLEFLLYVKKSFDPGESITGTILGTLHSDLISFSGDGSEFPLETLSSDEKFLWKLSLDYGDPRVDMFDQCVLLILNEKHPKYRDLKLDVNPMDSAVFREIMAQMFFLIITDLRKDPVAFADIQNNINLEPGSLGEAIYYTIVSNDLDCDDPLTLNRQIHEMVDMRAGGFQ